MKIATKTERDSAYATALSRIATAKSEKLAQLDLTTLGLTSVPPEIGELRHLESLLLDSNELSALPNEIAKLVSLRTISLKKNRFASVPACITKLAGLVELALDDNELRELPKDLWKLTSLSRLFVRSNKISRIEPGISRLANLQWLNLFENDLSSLPDELFELKNLRVLSVFFNQLETIPAAIGKLSKLTHLDLYSNRISSLPLEITSLSELEFLDIGRNPLNGILPDFGALGSLVILRMGSIDLKVLPESLRQLPALQVLSLHNNPDLKLSPSVLGDEYPGGNNLYGTVSAKSILDFYFGRLGGATRPLNEVKLILVGRGGAGKTSVVRALRNEVFDENESSTPGVALSDWTMGDCNNEPVTAHIWDFAGQVITHSLHQFFFSVRSVYVLVLSGRENHEREDAEYWLRLIKAFGTDTEGNGPPVVIALNKWDVTGCRPKVDRDALSERYPFIRGFFELDCKSGKGVQRLSKGLCREVDRLKWVRDPFPDSWDRVRRALAKGRGKKAHLTYAAYRSLCAENGVVNERQQDSLAEVLHNLGVALNYRNDPRLREATVLQPDWLTKNVYSLVRRAEKQSGLLDQGDIDSVLRYERDPSMRGYLIRIMERFEIAYTPGGHRECG